MAKVVNRPVLVELSLEELELIKRGLDSLKQIYGSNHPYGYDAERLLRDLKGNR